MGEIWCKVKIEGLKAQDDFQALFDSGSTYSHIDKDIAQKLGVMMLHRKVKTKIADGNIKLDEAAVAFATIDGCERPILVTVEEKGAVPVSIGMEAMQSMGVKLDLENESYSLKCSLPKS